MRSRVGLVLSGAVVVGGGALFFACGGTTGSGFGVDAGLDGQAQDGTIIVGDDATFIGDAPTSDAPGCARKCSGDFHAVLDCNDNVVETCAGADGCDAKLGTCGNACQAAVNNKQSVGCEYWSTFMEINGGASRCFAAFVANTWNTPVKIEVERGGQMLPVANFTRIPQGNCTAITYAPYNATTGLPPGQVAILFLGGNQGAAPSCPIASATGTSAMVAGTGKGQSFRIKTDVPVVAYEMNPYGGGSVAVTAASLLLPTSAWDTNYVANTASPQTVSPPSINVIATEDGTQVTMLPKVAVAGGGGLPSGAANAPLSFTLNRGEFAQFAQQGDLVGSVLQSTKPIGLMSGSACMNWPAGRIYCDHGEQMVPPVRALGSEYVAVPFRPRTMADVAGWRVIGAVDGTVLTYSPSAPPNAPAMLAQGQMAEFETAQPFVVKSQDDKHPFLLFNYMKGSGGDGYGDPDHVVSVPPQQYMSEYVFFTDPTFPETNLVVIRRPTAPSVYQDVTLDCAGTLGGWQTVGDYQWTRVDLQTGNFQNVGQCSNGRHEIKSKGAFGLWVWGWGTPLTSTFTSNVSYGYPGGMNVQSINQVVVPPTPK